MCLRVSVSVLVVMLIDWKVVICLLYLCNMLAVAECELRNSALAEDGMLVSIGIVVRY